MEMRVARDLKTQKLGVKFEFVVRNTAQRVEQLMILTPSRE